MVRDDLGVGLASCQFCLAPKHPGPCKKSVGDQADGGKGDGRGKKKSGGAGGGGDAKTGDEALDAAPISLPDVGGSGSRGMDQLTDDEHHALMYYRGEGYRKVTPALYHQSRSGGPLPPEVEERVGHLDHVLKKSPLEHDVVVYRGIRNPKRWVGSRAVSRDMTGLEWTDHGFLSSSTDPKVARSYARQGVKTRDTHPTVMRIRAPKGTGGVKLSSGRGGGESEILLPRGMRFRVTADHGVSDDGIHHIDVEIVG